MLKSRRRLGMASRTAQEQVIVTWHFDTRYFCGVHSAFLISLYMDPNVYQSSRASSMYKEIRSLKKKLKSWTQYSTLGNTRWNIEGVWHRITHSCGLGMMCKVGLSKVQSFLTIRACSIMLNTFGTSRETAPITQWGPYTSYLCTSGQTSPFSMPNY